MGDVSTQQFNLVLNVSSDVDVQEVASGLRVALSEFCVDLDGFGLVRVAHQTETTAVVLADTAVAVGTQESAQPNDTTACPHCGHSLTVDYWAVDCNGCGWGTDAASPNEGLSDRSMRGGI